MIADFDLILASLEKDLGSADGQQEIQLIKSKYLGKNSQLQSLFDNLKNITENKKSYGQSLNDLKNKIKYLIDQALVKHEALTQEFELKKGSIDPTLEYRKLSLGGRHPVSLARQRLLEILKNKHFNIVYGPEVENEYYNFSALNMDETHPARADQDTFYLTNGKLLRTHTSNVQIRTLLSQSPPLRIIAPGSVFRSDLDATHTPMFHQLEGLVVDKEVNMRHLKQVIVSLLCEFFDDPNLKIQFRPAYFPFTEPSAEVDIWRDGSWLEVLGCGMVHKNILKNLDIDTEVYQGYAFGLGIDRLAMIRYGISDLRSLFENDERLNDSFIGEDK